MAESPRRRYRSPSPRSYRSTSRSRSPARSYGGGSRDTAYNPGNNLYVTGLSTRVTEKDLEDHFSTEGKVLECRLVVDPRTRESRGFGFVTMDCLEDAERCMKYLNRSILEGRVISVEKAKRKRARTPTPGKYLGVRSAREISSLHDSDRRRGSYDGGRGDGHSSRRSPRYSPYRGGRDYSPQSSSPYRGGSSYRRERSASPYRSPPRSGYSHRSRSRSRSSTPYYYR